MAVIYRCRHCGMVLGAFGRNVPAYRLGLHFLTPGERRRIITYHSNGDITVRVICDYCGQTLESHPELALQSNPLQ
ncbi:MAG: hypothetical protein BAA02_05860 [Paenibacillaceae bacterium ZCTH02-B3]|nr:MAG: hypothetical protein BAA02_05860 [Paenibacillaceae bacterium ZCTH02-B3]